MRNIKHLTLVLLIVTLTFGGCKKDGKINPVNKPGTQLQSKTTKQLLSFREHLKMKSGEALPVDSATWYLEGLLNLENANNNHQFDGLEFYHDTLIVNTAGNSLSAAELNGAYEHFTEEINLIAQAQNISNFEFDAIDISLTKNELQTNEIQIAMAIAGGPNTTTIINNYVPFGVTDFWSWGFGYGKCGDYGGQGGASDAAQQLNYKFNHPIALGRPGYYTDIVAVYAIGDEYLDASNPGPYCDYKIFFYDATYTGIWPCLAPNELNYYLSTLPYIINDKKPEEPAGLSYKNVSVQAVFYPDGTSVYFHYYTLNYGIFHEDANTE